MEVMCSSCGCTPHAAVHGESCVAADRGAGRAVESRPSLNRGQQTPHAPFRPLLRRRPAAAAEPAIDSTGVGARFWLMELMA